MSVLIRFAPESLTAAQYDEAIGKLGEESPDGREFHVCFGSDGNLRVSEVWDSREQFAAFGERLMPILAEVGINPGEPEFIEIHTVASPLAPSRRPGKRRAACPGRHAARHGALEPPVASGPNGCAHVESHDGARRHRANLNKIAELVGDPQAAPSGNGARRTRAVRQRVGDTSRVANLADDGRGLLPHAQRSLSTAVHEAVRRDLTHGEHEVRGQLGRQAGGGVVGLHPGADLVQLARHEPPHLRITDRRRQWLVEGSRERGRARVARARRRAPVLADDRVGAAGLVKHRGTREQPSRMGTAA